MSGNSHTLVVPVHTLTAAATASMGPPTFVEPLSEVIVGLRD